MLSTQNICKIHNLEISLQVERDIDADKIQQLEDKVKILNEQIESLKLILCYKSHELEEIQEELNYTNHELYVLNELYATSSEALPINEVKKLTKDLLENEQPINTVLVE
jgi:archaellum component FlaC